jgi:diguanylate cyclase (GGDEF)-like protein
LLKEAEESVVAATSIRTQGVVVSLILLMLFYWGALLFLSLPSVHAPRALVPALIAVGLPLFALLGFTLWRQGSLTSAILAYRDDLTDLGNRRAFRSLTKERLSNARTGSLAMILIDVDQMKVVNDVCGHQAGDELLSRLARRLQKVAPDPGLVFRFGGDEFAILVDRADGQAAADVISKLRPFEDEFDYCGHEHLVNISYGFVSNLEAESFDGLFSRADQRLREFKLRVYNSGELADRRAQAKDDAMIDAFTGVSPLEDRRLVQQRHVMP